MNRVTNYDVALSFAGEDRGYVDQVANLLKQKGISVFYDLFEEENLWGKNLYDYLSDIYQNQAKFTIIFISVDYIRKLWPDHERQSMQARAFKENKEYILPARFDNTDVKGILPTIGYIDLTKKTPEQLVEIIGRKLVSSGGTIPSENLRKSLYSVTKLPKIEHSHIQVSVINQEGIGIPGTTITLIADNSTTIELSTNETGSVSIPIPIRRNYTVLLAHQDYPSSITEKFDPITDLRLVLTKRDNIGSIICHSTCYIPGLSGRLNPILDTSDRMYLYAENIAIEGGKNQPANFKINEPLTLEDNLGRVMTAVFKFIQGRTSVIDYIRTINE
jgi:hypothetical protein